MAIVDMKKAALLGLKSDERAILKTLQKLSCFQVIKETEADGAFAAAKAPGELGRVEDTMTRVSWAISRLQKYDKTKKPFLGDKPSVSEDEAQAVLDSEKTLMQTVEVLEALEREAGDLRGQKARALARLEQLAPWQGFALPIGDVQATRNTVSMLGTIQKSVMDAIAQEGELPALASAETVSTQRDLAYIYVVAHRSAVEETLQILKKGNFSQVVLQNLEGTVSASMDELNQGIQAIDARQEEIIGETAAQVTALNDLKVLSDCLASQKERLAAQQGLATSKRTFFVQGWVPAPMADTIEQALRKVSPTVSLEFTDPQEGEDPPVALHNHKAVEPFESIVSGFSLPAYGRFDPTAVMMPFYVNFMGMMISDAGYGMVMLLLLPILIKILKPAPGTKRMMWILTWGGLATVLWGTLYNTWFGFAPWPTVFDPMNNSLPVMAVCIGIGAVHLFTGLGVAAYMNIKDGKPGSAIADQLSWFLLVVGLVLMILAPSIGQWIALAGAAIILCTAGREKSKNPFKRLISGLGALYGMTSWVSDLLSYMRLFGMGLATGVIGMVVNQLVGMVFGAGPIGWVLGAVLFVGAHLFNAGINILGAYVHSCRLQYIEFFGKFYEDGGKPFVPLTETNRYVYVKEGSSR